MWAEPREPTPTIAMRRRSFDCAQDWEAVAAVTRKWRRLSGDMASNILRDGEEVCREGNHLKVVQQSELKLRHKRGAVLRRFHNTKILILFFNTSHAQLDIDFMLHSSYYVNGG